LEIIFKKIDDLMPYINNARTHSITQINQIAASIKEFGFTQPILIDNTNMIIAGHGRLEAARKLKYKELPCVLLTETLTEQQKRAYIIADNKLSLNSGWDYELLKLEMEMLSEADYNMELLGFESTELSSTMGLDDGEIKEPMIKDLDYKEVYEIIVECKDENQQQAIYDKLTQEGLKCRVLSM
jgi:ParB-like chromosome segregation protein Spo0J